MKLYINDTNDIREHFCKQFAAKEVYSIYLDFQCFSKHMEIYIIYKNKHFLSKTKATS